VMNFSEASRACKDERVVYFKDEPHIIVYTTAGGMVRPAEGIAHIRPLGSGDNDWFEVTVPELCLHKAAPQPS
jgi:hypothetical protein